MPTWNSRGHEERSDNERRVAEDRDWLNEKCITREVMEKRDGTDSSEPDSELRTDGDDADC